MHDGICNVFLCLCWALLSQSVHSYHLNAFVQLFQLWNPSSDWEEMYHSEYSIFLVSRFQRDSFSLKDILAIFPSFLLFLFSPFLYLNSPIFFYPSGTRSLMIVVDRSTVWIKFIKEIRIIMYFHCRKYNL